jgi:periplasmic protein TonB
VRRLRNIAPALSPVAMDRLGAAVVASALAHVFLIYGLALPEGGRSDLRQIVIQARLDVAQGISQAPAAERVASRVLRTPESAVPLHGAADNPGTEMSGATQSAAPSSRISAEAALPSDFAQATARTEAVPPRSEPEMVAIPDPVHYEARELDIYPRSLQPIAPTYPASARDAQVAGSVTLLVLIDEGGRVVSASVVDAEPGGVFDQAAQEAVTATAFYPAQRNGRTVRSQTLIKVEFDPRTNL